MHPRWLIGPDCLLALELWREYRGGGFGAGPLPEPGGSLHQPACLMAAFRVLAGADAALRELRGTGAQTSESEDGDQ